MLERLAMTDVFQNLTESADQLEGKQNAVARLHDHLDTINRTLHENGWAHVSLKRKSDRLVIRVAKPERSVLEQVFFSGISKYVVNDAALDRDVDILYDGGEWYDRLSTEEGTCPDDRAIEDHLAISYVKHVTKQLSLSPDQMRTIAASIDGDTPAPKAPGKMM
ncbi:MAG: hypothetical protein Alpg2KO_29090 [Alphaproteobacteria bacterium]